MCCEMARLTYAIASALDVLSTWYGLDRGIAHEVNPFMVGIASSLPKMIAVKVVGFLVIAGLIVAWLPVSWRRWVWWALVLMTLAVVVNNVMIIGG